VQSDLPIAEDIAGRHLPKLAEQVPQGGEG
jgi:hypothetical protein